MTTNQLLYVKFYTRVTKSDKEIGMLYMRISYNTKRIDFSFNHKVKLNSWNSDKETVKSTDKNFREINRAISTAKTKIFSIYEKLKYAGKTISPEILKNNFLGNTEKAHTLSFLIDYHYKTQSVILSPGTLAHYKTTERYLIEFLCTCKKMDEILIKEIDYQFITDFDAFLRTHQPVDHQRPMSHNVVMKHMTRFRKLLNLASKLDWITKNPFVRYTISYTKVDRGHLTNQELQKIINKEIRIERLQLIRDLFVFSCYTGLAYTDVRTLKPENIVLGIDGDLWIHTKRQKTNIPIQIPLLPIALDIVNKYKDSPKSVHNNLVFPPISNQKLNSYLKEIADNCDIHKNLTFHIARHTFATSVALGNGVPIETVSKILGHTKLSTTQIFARVLQDKISQDMSDLNKKLQNATNDLKKSQNIIYK